MLSSNMRKLKSSYRHPFEYINPRLYMKLANEDDEQEFGKQESRLFVDDEAEF